MIYFSDLRKKKTIFFTMILTKYCIQIMIQLFWHIHMRIHYRGHVHTCIHDLYKVELLCIQGNVRGISTIVTRSCYVTEKSRWRTYARRKTWPNFVTPPLFSLNRNYLILLWFRKKLFLVLRFCRYYNYNTRFLFVILCKNRRKNV